MTGLQTLAPQSHAVLSLVLSQGKSFAEIGGLLRIDPGDVRARAHLAAEHLAVPPEELTEADRAAVVDYILGQDRVSARRQIRDRLREEGPQRDWALELSDALAPIAREPLAPVPEASEGSAVTDGAAAAVAEPSRPRPTVRLPRPEPRHVRLVASLAGLLLVIVVLVLALSAGSGKRGDTVPGRRKPAPGATSSSAAGAQTIKRVALAPTSLQPNALGAVSVMRHGASLLLVLQARGLAPNHGDSYGVWLFNSPSDARLLGFVAPPVGATGTFSSGVTLPADAIRFRMLIVTREQVSRPSGPGPAVLRGSLALT